MGGNKYQTRIVELQRSLNVARDALERIKAGTNHSQDIAADALDELFRLERAQPLQGLVGHERRPR